MSQSLQNYVNTIGVDASSLVDAEIGTLHEVLDPTVVGKQLAVLLDSGERWGTVHDAIFRPLKWHKGKRCTLEIVLRTNNGSHPLIAKVYSKDRLDAYQLMEELWRGQFGQSARFSIPQPLAYVSSLRLLLQEKLEAKNAKEIFLTGDEKEQAEAAEGSALWLAHFHEYAPRSGKVSPLELELARMERWTRRFGALDGPLHGKAKLLFERLNAASPSLGTAALAAGHGSYSPDHVFFVGDRVVTIDWDGFDAGDPARDVARFIVTMQRLAVGRMRSIRALDFVADVFLDAYVRARGSAILSRLPFYRAAICLKLAKYGAFHHRVSRWEEKVAAMLEEGLRILEVCTRAKSALYGQSLGRGNRKTCGANVTRC